ncbi:hypothetical protein VTI28DRAFT_5053 [Corynascus sepedonium]
MPRTKNTNQLSKQVRTQLSLLFGSNCRENALQAPIHSFTESTTHAVEDRFIVASLPGVNASGTFQLTQHESKFTPAHPLSCKSMATRFLFYPYCVFTIGKLAQRHSLHPSRTPPLQVNCVKQTTKRAKKLQHVK